jgi:glycine cleavage system H lipoate-binding protein
MPVSGKLVQVNRQLLTKPKADLLELKVPDNWLGMILPDEIETSQLLTAKDYLEILSAKQ